MMTRKEITVVLLTLACQACESTTLGGGASKLATDPKVLDLGRVFIGNMAREKVVLSAPGTVSTHYSTRLEGDTFGYQVGPAVGAIPANGSVDVIVVFRPGREGPSIAHVVFQGESETATAGVELRALGAEPPDCEDGNGCTVDAFDLETGECHHDVARLPCDDFNACTRSDTCVEGQCLGESFSCDDHDVCTDDLCDPGMGCVNLPTETCEDHNPCTLDLCDPTTGCDHRVLPDGSPCDDLEQCTIADICLLGQCVGVAVPEGTACDDGDPCSKMDHCVEGTCLDPSYHKPDVGEVKFSTEVGPLAEGASANPIVDRDGTVFVGIEGGVAAVDRCGETLWKNADLGTPSWRGAVSLPGIISVPIEGRVVDLDSVTGLVLREVDTSPLFTGTSTRVRVVDLAVRASGALVTSVIEGPRTSSTATASHARAFIAEVDPLHLVATPLVTLRGEHAERLAIDADEAVVAILRRDAGPAIPTRERIVRFGLAGLPDSSWSTSATRLDASDLALGPLGEVLWTDGLIAVTRLGAVRTLLGRGESSHLAGAPVTFEDKILFVQSGAAVSGLGLAAEPNDALVKLELGTGSVLWRTPLTSPARGMTPAVDQGGTAFLVTQDGTLHAVSAAGGRVFDTVLPIAGTPVEGVAVSITPEGVVVVVAGDRVVAVQSTSPLSNSSWPRNRRDNLSTGHR